MKQGVTTRPSGAPPIGAALASSPFVAACRGEPTARTPVWLMRQAGRAMKEYRDLRKGVSFLELCKSPELCTEMAVLARRRLNVDAAIVFADILLLVEPLGLPLDYRAGDGPVIDKPVRTSADVDALHEIDGAKALPFVLEAVRQTRAALPADIPLIGFAGAPFTVASYMIEGGHSRNFELTKTFMRQDEGAWNELMSRLVRATAAYMNAQVQAGAQVLQIFDSWVGNLSPGDYRRYVLPHTRELVNSLYAETPIIHFGLLTSSLLEAIGEIGADVVALDFRVDLADGWRRSGATAVQGNLDPTLLMAPRPALAQAVKSILKAAGGRPGHIMNLGGGLLPDTDFQQAIAFVETVHEQSQRQQ